MSSGSFLSALLPYETESRKNRDLKKALIEFRFLVSAGRSAIEHFLSGDYEKFDSLVGENACQIRAVRIALLAQTKNPDYFDSQLKALERSFNRIKQILSSSINKLMQDGITLQDVLKKEDLDIFFSGEDTALIQSYLLSEMKECFSDGKLLPSILRKERCSPSRVQKKYPDVSYSFVEKLAKKLRVELSFSSVEFVRLIAKKLNDGSLMRMVGEEFEERHNKLTCAPTFWTFKTLFTYLTHKTIPLIFQVKFLVPEPSGYRVIDEEYVCFKPCPSTNSYKKTLLEKSDLEKPACIIQGAIRPKGDAFLSKENWREILDAHSPLEMLFCMGADHRQYPDEALDKIFSDKEYLHYKKMALEEGFSLSNPTKFFVQHIFCSKPSKILREQP